MAKTNRVQVDYQEFDTDYIGCTFKFPRAIINRHKLTNGQGLLCTVLSTKYLGIGSSNEPDQSEESELQRITAGPVMIDVEDCPTIGILGRFNPELRLTGNCRLKIRIDDIINKY